MKKSLILIIFIAVLMFMAGCGQGPETVTPDPEPEEEDTAGETPEVTETVYFEQLKYDPESGSLMYTIVNDTGEAVTLGGDILLRKRTIDGLWVDMQPLQWNGDGIRFLVTELVEIGAGESHEGSLDLKNIYGTLLEGEYGISIQIGTSHGSETILGGFRVAPVM